jgi:DNA-binding CsgD family transcriptional regulator
MPLEPPPSLPGPLRPESPLPFVGRQAELEALDGLLARAAAQQRGLVLIGGEAGSGKSRLVREFARRAHDAGAAVLYGACDPVVPTPFGPFVEALDRAMRQLTPESLRADLGAGGGELTRILPDLPTHAGPLGAPVRADEDTERYRLHSAVGELLAALSRRWPLVVVLEDGHWADRPSLLLLRHLARDGVDARLLVVATFRDTEADVPAELADALAELRRQADVLRLRLPGLSVDEIGDFLERAAGTARDDDAGALADALGSLTGGNPFLLCELWQALVETGAVASAGGRLALTRPLESIATPESVREVVTQRLGRLDARTAGVLELAAVAGPEFGLDLLRRCSELDRAALAEALEQAARSGMVEELPGHELRWRFTHELVRRALYDRLSAHRRAVLHLAIGEALEAGPPAPAADLAHHFWASAVLGDAGRAVRYTLLAAADASAGLAFEDAAGLLRRALELGIDDPARRAEVQLELGTACYQGGAAPEALAAYRAAAELAHELGDSELLARAAIGFEDACWRPHLLDQGAIELLREASATLPPGDSPLRVGVLAGLARALGLAGEPAQSSAMRREAVAMARRIGDDAGLARALLFAMQARGADRHEEVAAMLAESQALAGRVGPPEVQAQAAAFHVIVLIELGRLAAARREMSEQHALALRTRQPFVLFVSEYLQSTISLCYGELDEAEAAANRAFDWGRHLRGGDPTATHGVQMFIVRREQGRLEEVAPLMRLLAGGGGSYWRAGAAALLSELGLLDEARAELAAIRTAGLETIDQAGWLASVSFLADACAAVGDAELSALLYPALLPRAGSVAVLGQGVACFGAVDRSLGMLAAALGEPECAAEHFERALALNRRIGAATWVAHTGYEYGRLLAGGAPAAAARGDQLLAEAAALAEGIGMPTLLARIRQAGLQAAVRPLPDGLSEREAEVLRLVADGLSNREIGRRLHISEHTAANHVRAILRKTACANRTQATSYAHRHGIAHP